MRSAYTIEVTRDPTLRCAMKVAWLRSIVRASLRAEGVAPPAEVALLLATDDEIRRLNREYRGIDAITDVLSFALQESEDAFPEPPDGAQSLGQVVVSYPRAVSQAEEYGHSTEREVAFLIVHGVLHLLGHDHQTPEEEARMRDKQEAVLTTLGLPRT